LLLNQLPDWFVGIIARSPLKEMFVTKIMQNSGCKANHCLLY